MGRAGITGALVVLAVSMRAPVSSSGQPPSSEGVLQRLNPKGEPRQGMVGFAVSVAAVASCTVK
jgi:hypothetical protein